MLGKEAADDEEETAGKPGEDYEFKIRRVIVNDQSKWRNGPPEMLRKKDDPYGILILAFPFLVGGWMLLFKVDPAIIRASPAFRAPGSYTGIVSVPMEHAAGAAALIVGILLIWLYVRAR